ERAEEAEARARRQMVLRAGRLHDAGAAAREVADRAIAHPAGPCLHVRGLGAAELSARGLYVVLERLGRARDVRRLGEVPAVAAASAGRASARRGPRGRARSSVPPGWMFPGSRRPAGTRRGRSTTSRKPARLLPSNTSPFSTVQLPVHHWVTVVQRPEPPPSC